MNKARHIGSLIFFHLLVPIIITFIAKWLISLCTAEISSQTSNISQDAIEFKEMIISLVDAFEWVIAAFIGVLSYFFIYSKELKDAIDSFKIEFSNKLVQTNAVIKNPETKKIAITAKELDFYERKIYSDVNGYTEEERKSSESIDILRSYSFQDLLFSPRYLDYFFNRGNQIGNPIRVVVIDDVCLATISLLFLSIKANYSTYIISNNKFRQFYSKQKRITEQKIIKGNPYLIKIKNSVKYGKYSNGSEAAKEIPDKEGVWELCKELIKNCGLVNETRNTFSVDEIKKYLKEIDNEEVNL
jgi:hypothetical protein